MQRRRFKQIQSLEKRLSEEAKRLREEAKSLPHGAARDALIRKARQAETGSHMTEWLTSPGLRPPDKCRSHLTCSQPAARIMCVDGKGCTRPCRSRLHRMRRATSFYDQYARSSNRSDFSYIPMRLRRSKLDI
jgi:hypothetical protein